MFVTATRSIALNPVIPYYCKTCDKLLMGRQVEVLYSYENTILGPYWVFCDTECMNKWPGHAHLDTITKDAIKLAAHIHVDALAE